MFIPWSCDSPSVNQSYYLSKLSQYIPKILGLHYNLPAPDQSTPDSFNPHINISMALLPRRMSFLSVYSEPNYI